ncbi:MAG: exodeoxyribonuclease VII large subunit [Beijerinckiaceae bacterium]|jgi:exodeoxyribonuclease VII large subunit|nr:exodeoxyribonuclease VII large subunit [Beijerinckiaceae bacterium]
MEPESNPATNALEWSVSDLSGALKRTIEDQFGFVRVRGEISGYRGPSASGHVYFSLKDANAKIDAVIWKGVFGRLRTKPQEGLEIIATGKITTFPGKSSYQIIIDHIEPAGLGALMALLEERRRKLAAEGLFDEARKQLLPYLPEVIGVITSPTGAVIRDILHRLEDRFPRRVLVWPVRVQGETSGAEVAAAIRGFNVLLPGGAIPRPDVLIVARGGGSLEDLMSFNDEAVVRAAAASAIPLISAVGHETDWTLIDYASDLRAPTPTGAAEKVVPVRSELMAMVDDLSRRRMAAMRRLFEQRRQALRAASRALPGRETLLNLPRQRLDLAATRLPAALRANALGFERRLSALSQRLQRRSPQVRLGMARERLAALTQRLIAARQATLREEKKRVGRERERLDQLLMRARRALATMASQRSARVAASAQLLDALSYTGVLKRGFALVRDAGGNPVRSKASALPGSALSVEFADGTVGVTVDGGTGPKPAPAPRKPQPAPQGGLFD